MEWKSEYGFIFFVVFAGAVFRLVVGKNELNHTISQRIIAQAVAVLFGGLLLIGSCLIWLNWSIWIPIVLGVPVGIVGEKFLLLWMLYGNQATGLLDFVRRMRAAYNMAKNNDSTNETDQSS